MGERGEERDYNREARKQVGSHYPLLYQMMSSDEDKAKKGIDPTEWHLFSSKLIRNPNVPDRAKIHITAKDFSYFTDARKVLIDKERAKQPLYVDGEQFGVSTMVQSVRKEGPSGIRSKWCRQITPLMPPQNSRYDDLVGCVLVTGGAGGLGRMLVDYLLEYYPNCSVAIASRSVKEGDNTTPRRTCYACDVINEESVKRVCDSIPDLVGVIHAAGVTYGGPFKMTNEDDSKLLMDIKYWGTRYIYNATKARKLRFFWMASSISAAIGDFNISHYAAANSSMDWFAEKMREEGDKNIVSTQWGALATEGGMALANTRKLMNKRGHGVVSPECMVDIMEIVIHQASDLPPVICVSPLNIDKCTQQKPELADHMTWFEEEPFLVYCKVLKADQTDKQSQPWRWPNIEELERMYGNIPGYTTAKRNAEAGLCRW